MPAFALTLLVIEFLDEFVGGARETAWPLIRRDLALTYVHIGMLQSIPAVLSNVIEPVLGILSDIWRRRALILAGGMLFVFSALLTAISPDFWTLLLSFILFYPASAAFVSLSQATLMDLNSMRREQKMARWTFAGSLGMSAGPIALGAAAALGLGWRGLNVAFAAFAALLLIAFWRQPFPKASREAREAGAPEAGLMEGFRDALRMLHGGGANAAEYGGGVMRWLVLLQFSDLMLDVLYGLLALYFVDVAGVSAEMAALAVTVWTVVGLAGDFLLIPLLEKVRGLSYLRVSAAAMAALFPAFLLVDSFPMKLVILGALGFLNSGWYAILAAGLYDSMPGRSGTALAVGNVGGLVGGLIPIALGALAQRAGLDAAMWALLAGPLVLLIGIPRTRKRR